MKTFILAFAFTLASSLGLAQNYTPNYPAAGGSSDTVSGSAITPSSITATGNITTTGGSFVGDGSGLTNLPVGLISATNPGSSQTILAGGISGTLAASATNTISMTTARFTGTTWLGISASTPNATAKAVILQTTDGPNSGLMIFNQSQSQSLRLAMDTSSQPCFARGATCMFYLTSSGIDVRGGTISATTLNLNGTGTANVGTLNVSTTSTLTGLLTATAGISATANVTATTFTSTNIATDGTGNFACYNTTTKAFTMSIVSCVGASDPALKINMVNLDKVEALKSILALDALTFQYKEETHLNKGTFYGVNALQVHKEFPELTVLNPDGKTYSVDYPKLVVPMLAAIQQQQTQIRLLTALVGLLLMAFGGFTLLTLVRKDSK